jgi:hypothetical protein
MASLDDPNARVATGLVTRLLALAEQRTLDPGSDFTQARPRPAVLLPHDVVEPAGDGGISPRAALQRLIDRCI